MANMNGTKLLLVMCVLSVISMTVKSAPALSLREEEPLLDLLLRNRLEMMKKYTSDYYTICGIVQWYDEGMGYGFIKPQNGPDVFVQEFAILDGYGPLTGGQMVMVKVVDGPMGPEAFEVAEGCY